MANIKYVCLSDLHLGAHTALFTDTPSIDKANGAVSAGPLQKAFSEAMVATMAAYYPGEATPSPAGLVLLGDIFDFSLGTPRASIDTFTALLTSLKTAGAQTWFKQFAFVPGNHDHELWTATRLQNMVGTSRDLNKYQHTTSAFGVPSAQPVAALINQVLLDNGFFSGATTFYPNMGLASADKTKAVVLHHGHFIEQMYTVMSTLTAELNGSTDVPLDVETLEKLNGSWIDFVWSSDGDDGRLGADIRIGFEYLVTGREDIRLDHRLARLLAKTLVGRLPIPQTANMRKLTEIVAKAAVDSTVGQFGQMERFSYFQTLGADGRAGLTSYLSGPVRMQIEAELGMAAQTGGFATVTGPVVKDLTFIFGHTHKPFERRVIAPGFDTPPAVYNTGGWDLDMPMFGTKLGAAAVFIDDDLNVASLRLCDVPEQDGAAEGAPVAAVRVETADGVPDGNPLATRLNTALLTTSVQVAWTAFSAAADAAYRTKQAYILSRLRDEDRRDRKTGRVL